MTTRAYFSLLSLGAIVFTFLLLPDSPKELNWVKVILLFAPTILIPTWLYEQFSFRHPGLIVGTWLLGFAFLLPQGGLAGSLALPWLLVTLWLGYRFLFFTQQLFRATASWSGRAAFLFLPVGAAWAVADRLGWQPMGFQATIVLLTAVHFHYAGFLLLSIADRLMQRGASSKYKILDFLLIAGVPLVALGITLTDLNGPRWIETFAATVMALGGIWVALEHLSLAMKGGDSITRLSWFLGGTCLLAGMMLAIAYGWRQYYPLDFLNIPWMYAVHGSLNFLGVGVFLLYGWYRNKEEFY
ncbi:MAG: YndJ family transporter [Saprospiraceae bacterium]|nr:YndJ family transporter [Saprospiraceae bacterium]